MFFLRIFALSVFVISFGVLSLHAADDPLGVARKIADDIRSQYSGNGIGFDAWFGMFEYKEQSKPETIEMWKQIAANKELILNDLSVFNEESPFFCFMIYAVLHADISNENALVVMQKCIERYRNAATEEEAQAWQDLLDILFFDRLNVLVFNFDQKAVADIGNALLEIIPRSSELLGNIHVRNERIIYEFFFYDGGQKPAPGGMSSYFLDSKLTEEEVELFFARLFSNKVVAYHAEKLSMPPGITASDDINAIRNYYRTPENLSKYIDTPGDGESAEAFWSHSLGVEAELLRMVVDESYSESDQRKIMAILAETLYTSRDIQAYLTLLTTPNARTRQLAWEYIPAEIKAQLRHKYKGDQLTAAAAKKLVPAKIRKKALYLLRNYEE